MDYVKKTKKLMKKEFGDFLGSVKLLDGHILQIAVSGSCLSREGDGLVMYYNNASVNRNYKGILIVQINLMFNMIVRKDRNFVEIEPDPNNPPHNRLVRKTYGSAISFEVGGTTYGLSKIKLFILKKETVNCFDYVINNKEIQNIYREEHDRKFFKRSPLKDILNKLFK